MIGLVAFLPLVVVTLLSGGVWYLLRVLDPRLQVFLIGISYDRPLYTLAFVILSTGLMLAGAPRQRRRPEYGSLDLVGSSGPVDRLPTAGFQLYLCPAEF